MSQTVVFSVKPNTQKVLTLKESAASQFQTVEVAFTDPNLLFYPRNNPSGYITSGTLIQETGTVKVTGDQVISGLKSFANQLGVNYIGDFGNDDAKIDLVLRQLNDTTPSATLDWQNCNLISRNSGPFSYVTSVDWNLAQLNEYISGTATLDWHRKILSGSWNSQGLKVSGNNVVTANQTGSFITSAIISGVSGLSTVNTIALLRSFNTTGLASNTVVYVKGYNSPGDRGGGHFFWSSTETAADDSGAYISPVSNPSTGRWKRMLNGETPNVCMWGAMGNSSYIYPGYFWPPSAIDDTSGIQRAINAVVNGVLGAGELLIPAGGYKVTDTLVIQNPISLHGEASFGRSLIMMETGINKDIFITTNASNYVWNLNNPPPTYPAPSGWVKTVDFDHQFSLRDLHVQFAGIVTGTYIDDTGGLVYAYGFLGQSGNSCFVFCQPGEAFSMDHCTAYGGGFGIRVCGGGAPGFVGKAITTAGVCAGFGFEPIYSWVYNGTGSGYHLESSYAGGSAYLINPSMDYRNYGVSGSLIRLNNMLATVVVDDMKCEGSFASGVVAWIVPSGDGNRGQLVLRGGSINGQFGPPKETSVVRYTTDNINNNVAYVPATEIAHVNMVSVYNLIHDVTANYKLPTEFNGGLNQAEARVPIVYQRYGSVGSAANGLNLQHVMVTKPDTNHITFYPAQTGWYRIAANLNAGTFSIRTSEDNLSFNVAVATTQGFSIDRPKVNFSMNFLEPSGNTNNAQHVLKARAYTIYESGYNGYLRYLDIFVDSIPSSPYTGISITHRNESVIGGIGPLIAPILVTGFLPSGAAVYGELTFRPGGLVTNGGNANESHIQLGERHIWYNENNTLRFFDENPQIAIVDEFGGGAGALAKPYLRKDGFEYTWVKYVGDSVYHSGVRAYAIPTSRGGAGAVLGVTTGALGFISSVDILNGGSGYGGPPATTDGYKILMESDLGNPVSNVRRVTSNLPIMTNSSAAGSKIISGTGYFTTIFKGDLLKGPDGNSYEVAQVISDQIAVLTSTYATKLTNQPFYKLGVELLPAESNNYYVISQVAVQQIDNKTWDSTSGFNRLVIRSKGANPQEIAYVAQANLTGGGTPSIIYVQPTGGNGGFGGYLSGGYGVEAVVVNASNTLVVTTGSGIARVSVWGIKNRTGMMY